YWTSAGGRAYPGSCAPPPHRGCDPSLVGGGLAERLQPGEGLSGHWPECGELEPVPGALARPIWAHELHRLEQADRVARLPDVNAPSGVHGHVCEQQAVAVVDQSPRPRLRLGVGRVAPDGALPWLRQAVILDREMPVGGY